MVGQLWQNFLFPGARWKLCLAAAPVLLVLVLLLLQPLLVVLLAAAWGMGQGRVLQQYQQHPGGCSVAAACWGQVPCSMVAATAAAAVALSVCC
jgi:hypothetical protein